MGFVEVRVSIRAAAVIALLAFSRAGAQCANGSPPPCRSAVAAKPATIDPKRVAVIPFRVTTADSLFGEGFAELLAPEFTGEGGPRAIDMSSSLAAWRRAGGGLRTPLSQEDAMRLARQLGAGLLCQGSIVGVGTRLTINASLVDASSGKPIGTAARAAGSTDSIDVLLGRIATELLGAGARARVAEAGRLTQSPAALRAYLEGLALRRRGKRVDAGVAFEASFAADTMFASAAFQRWLVAAALAGSPAWAQKTLSLKSRLTPGERMMIEASFPSAPRSRAQAVSDLQQAALRVESPEAWYLYADEVYHSGMPVVGPDSIWPISRRGFEHAMSIDSQPVSIGHLPTIAIRSRDTSLMRRLGRFYEHLDGEDTWATRWVFAGILGDAPQLARLRQTGPLTQQTEFSSLGLMNALDSPMPIALIEEGFRQVNTVATSAERDRSAMDLWLLHRARGQPAAAERIIAGQAPVYWRANLGGGAWPTLTGDLRDDEAYMKAFGSEAQTLPTAERRRQCVGARLIAQRGHADSLDNTTLRQVTVPQCARILEIWKAYQANALTDSALAVLDSIVTYATATNFMGFEHRLLSHIYEERGDTIRALRAVRLYPRDFPAVWLGPTIREEGRSYLLAHDTANAVRSYNHFLELRLDAEPPYVAERDSIKALVLTLTRRK